MNFDKLSQVIFSELSLKLQKHDGLSIFVRERAKFEGWLKVEVCDILSKHFEDVVPEKDRVDICFGDWVIELKTINTNYDCENVVSKTRPITMNTQAVIDDIAKLKSMGNSNKAVLFIVFPVTHENMYWQKQLTRISERLSEIKFSPFKFKNNVSGVIYLGLI